MMLGLNMQLQALWVLTSAILTCYAESPPIRTKIQASWDAAPLVVQILETASLEDASIFFPLLASYVNPEGAEFNLQSPLAEGLSSQQIYERAVPRLKTFAAEGAGLGAEAYHSFDLSLALREASPLIETHYQLFRQAEAEGNIVEKNVSAIQWYGDCVEGDVDGFVTTDICGKSQPKAALQIHPFDHVYNAHNTHTATLLVYADILSPGFLRLHNKLFKYGYSKDIRVVLRWKPSSTVTSPQKLALSGYGVGLDIKRVDYITIDDRDLQQETGESKERQRKSDFTDVRKYDGDIFARADLRPSELVQLKPEQLQDIGIRATQLILNHSKPLTALKRLSQDFPRYAHKLVTAWEPESNETIMRELHELQSTYVEEGRNYIWLNGMQLKTTDMQPFTLLRLMREERRRVESLVKLGLTPQQAVELLTHPAISESLTSDEPMRRIVSVADMGDIYDATDRIELQAAIEESADASQVEPLIVYWNDIEKDARYRHWPKSLQNLLQPTYPGQMPQVRRNIINVVLALDFEKTIAHVTLADQITPFISRGLGIRFGSVPILPKNSLGSLTELIAKASWYVLETAGRVAAMDFHRELASAHHATLTESDVRAAYAAAVSSYREKLRRQQQDTNEPTFLSFQELKGWEGYDSRLALARQYTRRLGLSLPKTADTAGNFFVNGKLFPLNDEFRTNLQQAMQAQMQHVMQQVYFNGIDDLDDVSLYFYDQSTTLTSRNPVIMPEEGKSLRFVDVAAMEAATGVRCVGRASVEARNASIWLFVDLSQPHASSLAAQAMSALYEDGPIRICIVPQGATPDKIHDQPPTLEWQTPPKDDKTAHKQDVVEDAARKGKALADYAGITSMPAIIINGRILEGFDADDFSADDFRALAAFEQKARIGPALEALTEIASESPSSDMIAATTSALARIFFGQEGVNPFAQRSLKRSRAYKQIPANLTSIFLGDESTSSLQLACIVDPLSEAAQSWSATLETMYSAQSQSMTPFMSLRLYLNPAMRHSDMPLKRFYRSSFAPGLEFDEAGNEIMPETVFHSVPQSTLLTLALDTQHPWQAFPKESVHDLDNIRLSDLKPSMQEKGVEATFELSNIIVEGHARESRTLAPPRGLQLDLSNGNDTTNTLVMANLGYHQLKANPGLWKYSIRPGRSAEVFELDQVEGEGAAGFTADGKAQQILLTTFEGVTIFPKFARKPGMDDVDLLDDDAKDTAHKVKEKASEALSGLKNRMQSFFGKSGQPASFTGLAHKKADINIFTVASGLLYERMAMIMILSVLRHTESTVKFWFIENFLSPSFKAFIPHLAKQYNFQYELVTYTWPAWLRSQKEKQRTIWGYKILFLDVLFPLELDRVIFVDSDQIVRTDLKQLVDLDLKGAPYAYAPMGDDREDMDNFRFWKGGYWADHLRGKPYHISALYVIDLDRFRLMAAGDRLRGQYQALSADPNSLANLDQDLPNNMQSQLPIYTLDRSWLWCETWCSDESLKEAKTIDLCNNPKTHEPKLARAKRLIPEWTVYDQEIAALASKIAAENKKAAQEGSSGSASNSAEAFTDEAGQLEQAREQQKEFVKEGTGSEETKEKVQVERERQGHIEGEL